MAILLASASLFAADPAATVELVNQKGSTIYKVVCKLPGSGKAYVKVSNGFDVLLSETVNFTNGFAYPLDFKGMASGQYIVEVLTKDTRFKQTIALENTKPVAYVRSTEQPGKRHLLTITSQVPAEFTIRIFDKYFNEVFTKIETVKSEYGVVLNMANLGAGYSFEITESTGDINVIRK